MSRHASLALLLAVSLALPLLADDGDLDPSFWADGKMAVDVIADATFGGLATDPGGNLAVAYSYVPPVSANEVAVWRSVGDSSVGGACVIDPHPGYVRDIRVFDAAFDAFGRLLVLARSFYDNPDPYMDDFESWFVLAYRFPDCALDAGFGGDGIVVIYGSDLPGLQSCSKLRPLADGRILVSGTDADNPGGPWLCGRLIVEILNPDGSIEAILCGGQELEMPAHRSAAVMAANGHIVATARPAFTPDDFQLVDFAPDGSVANVVTVAFDLGGGLLDDPAGIAATEDGRVVVAGTAEGSDSGPYYMYGAVAMLHWDAQGEFELDPEFSGDGKLSFTFGGRAYNELEDVVVQGDGRILVAGMAKYFSSSQNRGMAVARLLFDGSLDGDFFPSQPGWRIVDFDVAPPAHDRGYRVDLQNGRVVLAGTVDITDGIDSVGVARLLNSYVFGDGFEAPQAPGWLWVE